MKSPGGTSRISSCAKLILITAVGSFTAQGLQADDSHRPVPSDRSDAIAAAMVPHLEDLPQLYESVRKSLVRVERTDTSQMTGVIVSAEGHILVGDGFGTDDGSIWGDGEMKVHLYDGRVVTASAAGWWLEWRLAVMKIRKDGPWPAIQPGSTKDVGAGYPCLLLGYLPRGDTRYDPTPSARLGHIDRNVPGRWLTTTSHPGWYESPAIIGMDGRLLGVYVSEVGTQAYATSVDQFIAHREDLYAGRHVDWVRYPPAPGSMYRIGAGDHPERPSPSMRKTEDVLGPAEPLAPMSDAQFAEVKKIAEAATVRLVSKERLSFDGKAYDRWSGVIVSKDGYILTCGHAEQLPGEQLTVRLSDGRDADAVALGSNPITDVGLVKITTPGTWPFAEIAGSSTLKMGEPLVAAGYPGLDTMRRWSTERMPVVGATSVKRPYFLLWHQSFSPGLDRFARGGMSGGGLFNQDGKFVAVYNGQVHTRSEVARLQWDDLKQIESIGTAIGLPHPLRQRFVAPGRPVAQSVVELLVDSERVSCGTIVGADGWILTKASVLDGDVSCRLQDGSVVAAETRAETREHDLALLKVDVTGLSVAAFSEAEPPSITQVLCAVGPQAILKPGIVSVETRAIPPEPPWKGESTQDAPEGAMIVRTPPVNSLGGHLRIDGTNLRYDDIIVSVNGHATPDVAALANVLENDLDGYITGDLVAVALMRDGESMRVLTPLPRAPGTNWKMTRADSSRRSGFAAVFDTDVQLREQEVGCPVIDLDGRVRGMAIVSRGRDASRRGPTSVLPSHVVRRVTRELLARAESR